MQQTVFRPSALSRYLPAIAATAFMAAAGVPLLFKTPITEGPMLAKVKVCQGDGNCKEKDVPFILAKGTLGVGDSKLIGESIVTLLNSNGRVATMVVSPATFAFNQTIEKVTATMVLGTGYISLSDSAFSARMAARKGDNGETEVMIWTPVLDGI